MIPAFSPCCQQSPPSTSRIKGGTSSDRRNNKSAGTARESFGSSCLSHSCTLMSAGRAGAGLALCLRACSGAGARCSVPFTGKTLPSQAPKILVKTGPRRRIQRMEMEDGWGWIMDGSCRDRLQKAPLISPCVSPHFL